MRTEVTALVVRLPNWHVVRLGNPVISSTSSVTCASVCVDSESTCGPAARRSLRLNTVAWNVRRPNYNAVVSTPRPPRLHRLFDGHERC